MKIIASLIIDPIGRHYGLDWRRIGAFALLIVFPIGLYFAPGPGASRPGG